MPVLDQADERNIKDMSVVIEEQLARFILFWNEWNARPNALTSLINVQAMPDKVNRVD